MKSTEHRRPPRRSRAVTRRQREEMAAAVAATAIDLPPRTERQLALEACAEYNEAHPDHPFPAHPDVSKPDFICRIQMNYVRYRLVPEYRPLPQKFGSALLRAEAFMLLTRRVAVAARKAYPWLAAAAAHCVRDAEDAVKRVYRRATDN